MAADKGVAQPKLLEHLSLISCQVFVNIQWLTVMNLLS